MTPTMLVSESRRDEIITDAVRRLTPLVVTRHEPAGWRAYKSQFAGCNPADRCLFIDPLTSEEGETAPSPMPGELLGIAFRRGHKKCLFQAMVRALPVPPSVPGDARGSAVGWPDSLQELQRRVFQRACPPPDRTIRVRFRTTTVAPTGATTGDTTTGGMANGTPLAMTAATVHPGAPGATVTAHADAIERAGVMEDLSAGGIRVRCARADGLRVGDNVVVSFALRSRDPQFDIGAAYRHCEPRDDGGYSLGFQFLGLESSAEGQQTLARLARAVTDFQRAALRTRRPRLRPQPLRA